MIMYKLIVTARQMNRYSPSQINLSCVQREVRNEPRRLELFLYIDYRLVSHPSIRHEISIGPQPVQNNLLTISIIIITVSSFNYKDSISKTMKCEAFQSINNTG